MIDARALDPGIAALEGIKIGDDAVSFGHDFELPGSDVFDAIDRRVDLLIEAVRHYAVVRSGNAVTFVDWNARLTTAWGNTPECVPHWEALEEALKLRARLWRILTAALRVTADIAVALALASTALGALFAVRKLADALGQIVTLLREE